MRRTTAVAILRRTWIAAIVVGLVALAVAVFGVASDDLGGTLGPLALGVLAVGVVALAAEDFARADVRGELPDRVGTVRLRASFDLRLRMTLALAIAVGVPIALAALVVAVGAWQVVAAGVLIVAFTLPIQLRADRLRPPGLRPDPEVRGVLERLSFRADLRVPDSAVVHDSAAAAAWTLRGRIVVTRPLLELLDPPQLEAVLAHELAHLAHRDAPAMDVAAAPSRLLLSTWAVLGRPEVQRVRGAGRWLAVFMLPYALPLAWISRLAMLSLSRARDLRADAGAAALTGDPSALAAALVALDGEAPSKDLRAVDPLSVVPVAEPRWEWLSLHPSTATRVERLRAMEERLQTGR